MELYIIRHGQSTNNALQWINEKDRTFDPALSPLGIQQADAVARHIADGYNPDLIAEGRYMEDPDARTRRGFSITKLYCSPMLRTLQTARPIAELTGLTPQVWVDIHEHGGIYLEHNDERGVVGYPGKSRREIAEEFPSYVLTDDVTDNGWWTGAMEDISTAYGRAIKVAQQLRKLADDSPDERIALVTHGTFIDALLKALLNQLPGKTHFYYHYNTAMTRLDFHESGRLFIRFINRVDHLPADLMT